MKTLFESILATVLGKWGSRHAIDARSWLATAIVNSVAAKSAPRQGNGSGNGSGHSSEYSSEHSCGHGWQIVRAPAFIHVFRRVRRHDERSSVRSLLCAGLLAAVCVAVLWPGECDAQARCTEGKTASGQCTDAGLAEAARQSAIIFSQPKISYTAYPVLPSGDSNYRYPNQLIPDPLRPSGTGRPVD